MRCAVASGCWGSSSWSSRSSSRRSRCTSDSSPRSNPSLPWSCCSWSSFWPFGSASKLVRVNTLERSPPVRVSRDSSSLPIRFRAARPLPHGSGALPLLRAEAPWPSPSCWPCGGPAGGEQPCSARRAPSDSPSQRPSSRPSATTSPRTGSPSSNTRRPMTWRSLAWRPCTWPRTPTTPARLLRPSRPSCSSTRSSASSSASLCSETICAPAVPGVRSRQSPYWCCSQEPSRWSNHPWSEGSRELTLGMRSSWAGAGARTRSLTRCRHHLSGTRDVRRPANPSLGRSCRVGQREAGAHGVKMGVSRTDRLVDEGVAVADDLDVVELELLKLVRHLETFGRKSSLYQEVDRAGYLALRTLDSLGPSCINGLARELHLDSSTVTRQVSALESGGLVTRHVDPNDGRSWRIDIAPHGRKAMSAIERGRHQAIDSMLGDWPSQEVHELARMITKLNLALFDSVTD